VFRGTVFGWAQYAVSLVVTLILTPFVLGHVGPASYGVWLLLTQAIGYSGLLDLGIQPALVRYVSEARAKHDLEGMRGLFGTALRFYLGIGAVCVVLGMIMAGTVPLLFDLGDSSADTTRRTAMLAALAAGAALPAAALAAVLKGMQRYDLASILGVVSTLVRAFVTIIVLRVGFGLPGLAAAMICGNVATLALGALLVHRLTGIEISTLSSGSRRVFEQLFTMGAFSLVGTAGWQLAYGSDVLLVASRLTALDAAHFGLAVNVLTMLSAMVSAFTGNLLPLASAYVATSNVGGAQAAYLLGTRTALTLALPPAVFLLAEGPTLLTAWLGPAVGQPSGVILQLLVIAYLPSMLNSAGLPYALGMGLHRLVGIALLSEGLLKVGLSILWLRELGPAGIALATLVASLIHQGLLWPWAIGTRLQIGAGLFWTQALRPTLAPTLALAGSLVLMRYLMPDRPLIWRLVTTAVAAALCWAPTALSLWRMRAAHHPGVRAGA